MSLHVVQQVTGAFLCDIPIPTENLTRQSLLVVDAQALVAENYECDSGTVPASLVGIINHISLF